MESITLTITTKSQTLNAVEFFEWQEAYIESLEQAGAHPDIIISALDLVSTLLF